MKQNLLFNQASALGKRLAMVLTVLFTVGVGSMLGAYEYEGTGTFTKQNAVDGDGYYVFVLTQGALTTTCSSNYITPNTTYKGTAQSLSDVPISSVFQVTDYDATDNDYYILTNGSKYLYSSGSGKIAYSSSTQTWTTVSNKLKSTSGTTVYMGCVNSKFRPYSSSSTNSTSFVCVYKLQETSAEYTITLSENGEETTKTITSTSYQLPTELSVGSCDSKTFVGWTTTEEFTSSSTPTSSDYYEKGKTVNITENTTFYAVFATSEDGGTDYLQITSEDDLVAGGKYLIVGNSGSTYKALPVGKAESLTSVTPSSSKISNPATELVWTLEGSTDKWKIKSTSNDKYLQISSGNLTFETSTTLTFSVGVSSSKFTFTSSASSGNKILSYYHNGNKFNAYTTANTVYLYKQGATYSDYTTSCATQTVVTLNPNGGTISTGDWIQNGTKYTQTVETTDDFTLPTPTKTGYAFGGWYESSTFSGSAVTEIEAGTTGTKEFWAKWTAQQYTVQLDNQGATTAGATSVTATYNAAMPSIASNLPKKTGSTFLGYFTATSGGTKYYNADGTSAKNWDKTSTATLYAQWECVTPTISTQPQSATYLRDDDADPLSVVAAASDATLTYQWQKSTDNSTWSDITGATEATYKPSTQSVGTTYYQVVVTNSEGNCSATSDVATITVRSANCKWVETEIGDIESEDEVVVTMTNGTNTWALDQDYYDKDNSRYPLATKLDIVGTEIRDALNANNLKWNISGNATDGYILYPNGQTNTWLYCTGSSNTIKIGGGSPKHFVIENGYLKSKSKVTTSGVEVDAFLGVSPSTNSWRHYPNTTTSVISGQTLKLYKKECLPTGKYWINYDLTNVVCTDDPIKNKISTDDNAVELNFEATGEHNELPTTIIVTNGSTTLVKNTDYNWSNGVLTILNPSQITDNITISIAAQKRKYTVTFDANGHGTAPAAQSVTAEGIASEPTAPEATGYTFGGWYKEPECTTAFDFATPITGNITLYAKWTVNKYTITFKNYDGTELQSSEVAYGETPTYTGAAPTRGQTAQYTYTFSGWSPALYPADKDQEYTAQFNTSTRQYTVTWYDGTGNAHKTQTANYNATVALPTTNPNPCDDDYPHFIGWTADPITGSTTTQPELVENVKVTGDCDFYAVFAKGEGGSSDYKLVTSAPADWSGTYLIVNTDDKKAWKGSATSDNGAIDVTITNNTIPSNATTDNETFTIATMTGGYSIKGTSGKYISGTDGSNATNYRDAAQLNTISIDNNNNVTITSNTSVLRQNNSNASLFRYYKSSSYSSQHPIQLYKKGSGVNYTSFITTCCASWTAPTLTYITPLNAETSQTAQPQLGSGTTYGNATYTSSKPSVLSVDEATGEVTAVSKGTATITVTWEGNGTYCSVSATSNTITVNGSYSVTFHSNGGTGTMEPQKADPSTQRIAKLNKNEFTKAGYVFVGWKDASGVAYTDEQENITLTKNITLFAQWAPVVTLNDAGSEETLNPTAVGGTVTLPNEGANACSPYEFVGWTSVATADWNEGINEPALVATTYTPNAPTTLYAVYKIQSEGNANAFKLSFEGGNGKTYYVGEYGSSPYIRGYSNITKEEAVTFIRTKMYPNNDTKYYIYMEHKSEYLYYNGTFNSTSSPDENQGWVFHTVGDKIKLQSTYSYDPDYLSFSDRDEEKINISTSTSGSEFNMLSAVTSTYVASPLCNQEIEIIFETGNGDFVDNAPATNPLTVSRGDVITLPTCEYPGYEFMGWLKDEQQEEPSDIIGTYYTGDYTVDGVSSTITFYAYYKAIPEEVEFTGKDDVELLMYYYDGTANYYYAVSHAAERGELSSKQNCFNATTWTFTNVGNMQYHIQDETGKYLGAYSDGDNDLILSATPKVWTFTKVNGLWKMVCENSPSRALMYISTGKKFTNAAISNEGNGVYSYVNLGICPSPTYTTNPVLSQGFSITNTAMVTSASGQKVKAASALTLETRNIELPCTFTIAAPNITFYDNTGAEVTELESSAASEQFELHFAYKPTAENTMEYPTITITDDEHKTYTIKNRIYARSLPTTFAIVAKVGGIWYALPSQGLNSTTPPAAYPVEVDDMADPTAVTAVPANADWSLRQVYASSGSNDRFTANGDNLVFVNNASPAMTLNASSSEEENYLLTDAQYANYYRTNPGLYEWTPTTTDLETYQLTNEQRSRTLSVNTATVFGVHAQDKAVEQVRFLPIQNRYTPAALQVVEWKENSVVIMYNGDPAQTASVSVNGAAAQTTALSSAERDIAVYELAATGLAANPTQRLSITIDTEKVILPIPYIVSSETTDLALLPGDATVSARQEVAKVADLVVLKDAKLTAAGAPSGPYKFRNVTIYGGGKLVIPSDKGFGVASLTLRAGGITDAGEYDYVYPQFELRGTFTNTAGKFYYDYITDNDHWYHLVLPFAGELGSITYPTEFYGTNVTADNTGSWVIKRYAGEIRATGNYNAWKDIEAEGKTATSAGQGYIFWGAPKKVTVNGETDRQKWGIQRITMPITAGNAIDAENDKEGGKTISDLGSYENIASNSGKPNDQGWNLIGNPYMVNLTTMAEDGLKAGKLEKEIVDGNWTGKWFNDGDDIRYLTIPSDHFDTYEAKTVSAATTANNLVPGRAFFVQLEGEANGVTFSAANRASLMPQRLAAQNTAVEVETGIVLSSETMQDEVNFWIKDGKTNDYEYNADYPKTPNNTNFNIYGVHAHGDLSWVATGPEYAEESMPIGYQVPAAGTYMLSLSEIYNSDGLDALYVTDHALSPEVTVDLMSSPYEFSVNQAETNNERFTVSIKVKEMTESDTTGVDNVGAGDGQVHKFIYQDKMYILHHGVIYDATGKRVITINK